MGSCVYTKGKCDGRSELPPRSAGYLLLPRGDERIAENLLVSGIEGLIDERELARRVEPAELVLRSFLLDGHPDAAR